MAIVTVNRVREVRNTNSVLTKAYIRIEQKVDDALVTSATELTSLDGAPVLLDSTEGVWKIKARGGNSFLTDTTGKNALGF